MHVGNRLPVITWLELQQKRKWHKIMTELHELDARRMFLLPGDSGLVELWIPLLVYGVRHLSLR